jgi:hypothetical protein
MHHDLARKKKSKAIPQPVPKKQENWEFLFRSTESATELMSPFEDYVSWYFIDENHDSCLLTIPADMLTAIINEIGESPEFVGCHRMFLNSSEN